MWRTVKNLQTDLYKQKVLKFWVIILITLLVVWWVRAWLTKVWVIPNWFNIRALYSRDTVENVKTINDIDNYYLWERSWFKEPLHIFSQKWKWKMKVKTDL